MTILKESLEYHDMKGQLEPTLSIDEYAAKVGPDHEIVTLSFIVKSKLVGEDLVSWFEKGYDFVLDASVSDGELEKGKFLVFVELDRRSKVPNRIMLLLEELETLTDISVDEWEIVIKDEVYAANEEIIREKIILNPNLYRDEKEKEGELNEMRVAAGIDVKKVYNDKDALLKDFLASAGL
jgi:translation initiation factor IF-2